MILSRGARVGCWQAPLYRAFYAAHDRLGFQLVKVAGHARADSHDTVRRIFSYVDREVRKALGLWMGEIQNPLPMFHPQNFSVQLSTHQP